MTDLTPLLDDEPNEEMRRLLGSTRLDVPPEGGKGRLLAAIGVGTGAALSSGAAAAATATVSAAGPAGVTAGLVAKWVAWGALAGTLVAGSSEAVFIVATRTSTPKAAVTATERHEVAATRPAAVPRVVTAPPPIENAPPPPAVEEEAPAAAPESSAEAAALPSGAAPSSSLSDEITALDTARQALIEHHPFDALVALDVHDKQFPAPQLGPETTLLRIQALTEAGRRAAARAIGERFLAAHPESTHADRVRRLLATETTP